MLCIYLKNATNRQFRSKFLKESSTCVIKPIINQLSKLLPHRIDEACFYIQKSECLLGMRNRTCGI